MFDRVRSVYARLRRVPLAGAVASRLVGCAKAALGRPVRFPAPPLPPEAADGQDFALREARLQVRMQLAETLLEALAGRAPRPPAPCPRRAQPRTVAGRRTISVVVSTYDRARHLRRALAGLAVLRHPAFEVIVVDGPSTDDTAEVLAAYAGRIRVARCPEPNLARSRNIGLAIAAGEIVAFIDDDAVPEPDWLDALERGFADPAVGGVGGFIRDHAGVGFQCKVVAADRLGDNCGYDNLAEAEADGLDCTPGAARYLSLTGANSAFRRAALVSVGGFDEAYAYFLDETDLCLRLVDAGWTLTCAPSAEVHHAYAESRIRRADRTPRRIDTTVGSAAYFAIRNGLGTFGLARVIDHLAAYATGLKAEMDWRRAHGVIDADAYDTLIGDIDTGLASGLRAALSGPRRLAEEAWAADAGSFLAFRQTRAAEERLRLCLISQQYPPGAVGGIAVWTETLAATLASAGHEVTVIAASPTGEASVSFDGGVWVHRIAPGGALGRIDPPFGDLPAGVAGHSLAVLEEIRRIDPRRRFGVVMGPVWDLEPAAALAQGRWPVVVSLHTPYALSLPFQPGWRNPAYRVNHVDKMIAGERALLARAPVLLADSAAIVEDMARAYDLPELPARAVVIPHGLPDLAAGVSPPPRRESGTVEILFVGRLEPRKGADLLLEVIPQVLAEAPQARFTLVGDDAIAVDGATLRERFERRWAGGEMLARVTFTGAVGREELLRRYAGCDLFVAPSRYESFGLSFLEAMIFAKPCVGLCAGAVPEVVAHGETGLLVPPDDEVALVCAILALVRDPDRRAALGRAGRARYEALFTAGRMGAAVERLLWTVTDGARRRPAPAIAVPP